ncbi:MAG: hypothetical protein QOH41_1088 [Blastocatellia bacterium]|nr:hypothetical protein [Blastocatellia bacterium]
MEVDTFQHGNYPGAEKNATWRKATIIRLYTPEDRFGGYIVKVDEDGREMRLRFVDTQWMRAPQGSDAPAAANNKTEDQATNTQTTTDQAQAGTVSCPASDDLKGTSQLAIFKRLVADRYERNGKSRDENHKNVSVSIHFDDFKTGATHPYRHMINNPDGPDGVAGGTVYPVKATYLVCEDYPGFAPTGFKGELLKTEYENMTYSCFKDATGDWVCKQTGGREGRPQHVPK